MLHRSSSEAPTHDSSQAGRGRPLDVERLPDHLDRLFRAAYAICGSREDAEDLVQETYERVLRRPRFLRRDDDLAYLLRTLRNAWTNRGKAAARHSVPVSPDDLEWVHDPSADPARMVEARAAYGAISRLAPPLRETLVAVDIVGLSYQEAARALDTRPGTIMSRLSRARDRVAEEIGAPGDS